MDSAFYILGPYAIVCSTGRHICRVFKHEANSRKIVLSVCGLLGIKGSADNPNICDELVASYGVNSFLELSNYLICSSSVHPVQTYILCTNTRKELDQISLKLGYADSKDTDNYTLSHNIIEFCKSDPSVLEKLIEGKSYLHDAKIKVEDALNTTMSLAKDAMPRIMQTGKDIYARCGDLIGTIKDVTIFNKHKDSNENVKTNDVYSRAISLIQTKYPHLYEHVALMPGEISEHVSLAYDSESIILHQQGYVINFPCDKEISKALDQILKSRNCIVDIGEFEEILRSKGIRSSVDEFDIDGVDIELDRGEVVVEQPDKFIENLTGVSTCKVCKGKGYLPCPDKECRGRHEYTCPSCKGDGKIPCGACNSKGEVKCPTCKGAGKYTCKQCHGEGEFQCSDCKGRGRVKCSSCKGKGRVKCRRCNGLGKMQNGDKCTSCYGDGYIKCQECNGIGEYKCVSCNGKGVKTCNVCHGQRIVTCSTCNGDKKVECRTCHGKGELTCRRCSGYGEVVCSTCLGDKEHYGMIECKKCDTSGHIGHLCYVHSNISTKRIQDIPSLNCNNQLEHFDRFINFPELRVVYKNINSKKTTVHDESCKDISDRVNYKLGVDFKSQNPRVLKQSITYQKFLSVFITCRHIVSNLEFDICVLDIDGPDPLVIFPDYDNVTFKKSGLFKRIGLVNAKFFNTDKYRGRVDKFNSVKAYLIMSKINGEICQESRPLLLRLINGVDELTSEEKATLYLLLNAGSISDYSLSDIEFTSKEVAEDVYENLKAIAEVDGQVSSDEETFLTKFEYRFLN